MMNWEQLAQVLIDYLCEAFSVEETITLLFKIGCKKELLICLGFDEEDITNALEEVE